MNYLTKWKQLSETEVRKKPQMMQELTLSICHKLYNRSIKNYIWVNQTYLIQTGRIDKIIRLYEDIERADGFRKRDMSRLDPLNPLVRRHLLRKNRDAYKARAYRKNKNHVYGVEENNP